MPILGPRISTSHTVGTDPWLPVLAGKGDEPKDKQEEDQSQRHSSSPVAGGLAGKLGKESLELGKCRGLLQGLLSGLTLAPALEMQVERWGRPGPFPPRAPWFPLGFQSFGQDSPGQLWASLGLPGHLGSVGPANGTRPVGLGRAATHQAPLSHLSHPLWVCSTAWWGLGPLNAARTSG